MTTILTRRPARGVLIAVCLGMLGTSLASDADAQARRRRPLFGAGPVAAVSSAVTRQRAALPRPRAKRERVVSLVAAALDPRTAADGASDLDLQLFPDKRVAVQMDRIERRSATGFTWHGRVVSAGGGWANFASNDGIVAGTVFANGATYQVGYASRGLYEVRELDPAAFPTDDPDGQVPPMPVEADEVPPIAPLDAADQIDVLVVWTPAARAEMGSAAAIQSEIDLAIANTNTAYANSGIATRVRLINKQEVTYTESSISTDLDRLRLTADGFLDTVHTLRDQYGADMVSLIGSNYTSACGIGYLMTSPSTSFAVNAFTVVDVGCAAGNLSLAHELGHNQGMHHDVANASGTGAYPYSYGFQDATGDFRTVMAYACGVGAGCPRVPYFSTPDVTYTGQSVGNANADNAQTLNNTATYVANFRQEVIGTCNYVLSPTSWSAGSSASTQNVGMTVGTGCAWTTVSNAAWLTVTANATGSGPATITLSVSANGTGAQRSGAVTAGGQTITVTQAAVTNGTPPSFTAPSGTVSVAAADDFAVNVLQDRWDMNDRWDLGWFMFSADQPAANLTSPTFTAGLFSATTATSDPSVWLLETGYNPYAALTGRTGAVNVIDANKYRRLNVRMCLPSVAAQAAAGPGQLFWNRGTIYSDNSTPTTFNVYGGCGIYSLDLTTWSASMPVIAGLQQYPWNGTMRGLRFDPTNVSGRTVQVDWASLTATTDANATKTITWTGTAPIDLFLDTDNSSANGNLGLLWKDGAAALGVTGGSYSFQLGGLPPGDYYVAARQQGTSTYTYSSGFYRVATKPLITVLSPSEEGSADDFATVQLGDPWDMTAATDIDHTSNVTGLALTSLALERTQGTSLGTQAVVRGTSTSGAADPMVWLMWNGGRGRNYRIDTSRYRILTFELGMTGARNINGGSVARIIWKRADESLENVSNDVVVNHRQGVNSLDKIVVDMADRTALPLEDGAGSPSRSGWTGQLDSFRIDPHEFSDARQFWFKRVKLAALDRAAGSYTVRWQLTGADPTTRISLYRDADATGFNGTLIASNLVYNNETDGSGSYAWNVTSVPTGTYYLYVVATVGGVAVNQQYARWPVVVNPVGGVNLPVVHVNRPKLYFTAIRNGAAKTAEQEVGVTFSGGVTSWTATPLSTCSFVQVTGGSGTGAGSFRVAMENRTNYPNATYTCGVRIDAPGATNTPQFIDVQFIVKSTGTAPVGTIDTPADNTTVSGAFALTGWAVDDMEVTTVSIWRDTVAGETSPNPNGKIYVADAVQLEDARPDVAALYPSYPMSYRAGWGVLVLSNQLPNGGNGSFRFWVYAIDPDGHTTTLGSRRVTGANATSLLPFGTIDTPAPGASVSGVIPVFGWVLTPLPAFIPTDGSTITVFVDGVAVGHPDYNFYRSDIADAFPGLANSAGAIGVFMLDTTTLANGLHTISWGVTDSAGHSQGIGSRFFRVRN